MTPDNREILICTRCWGDRNETIDQHTCSPRSHSACDCPCVEPRHRDLDTIDLDHDLGMRDILDPFSGGPTW